MKHLFAALAAAIMALSLPAPEAAAGEYVESFEDTGAPGKMMGGSLLVGDDGVWQGELRDGSYHLSNAKKPGVVRYFQVNFRDAAPQDRSLTVSVEVDGQFDGKAAGAGLIYGLNPASKTYYAFVLSKDGRYTLWQRDANGFRQVASGSNDAIKTSAANRLTAKVEGSMAELSVNGERVFSHSAEGAAAGSAGIVALDTGDYRFDNFRLATE